jgi:xylan 1,4-beta-xylosidase
MQLLHGLGNERIALDSNSAMLTRSRDGSLVLALWNLWAPDEAGSTKTVKLQFRNVASGRRAYISRVDRDHGDPQPLYRKMGSPRYPTRAQLEELRKSTQLPPPEVRKLGNGELTLTLPAHGLAVIEVK